MTYNLTNITANVTIVEFTQNVNTELMFGWLGHGLLISFMIILLLAYYFRTGDFIKSIASSCFIIWIVSILFLMLDLTNILFSMGFLIAAAVALATSFKR